MSFKRITISVPDYIDSAMSTRGDSGDGKSSAVVRTVDRYLAILNRAKIDLAKRFDRQECALILDSCNGVAFFDTVSIQLLPENIVDGIGIDGLDKKWSVDGETLIAKLRTLTYPEKVAMVDAITIWWNRVGNGESPDFDEMLIVPATDRRGGLGQ